MTLGDFDPGLVVYGKFTTYRPSTGAPYTLAGTPGLVVYKDGATTPSSAGVTLTVDFNGVVGLGHFAINTAADATFYAGGSSFDVVISAGTVDGVGAVGTVVGRFSLRKTSELRPTTAGRTLPVGDDGRHGDQSDDLARHPGELAHGGGHRRGGPRRQGRLAPGGRLHGPAHGRGHRGQGVGRGEHG